MTVVIYASCNQPHQRDITNLLAAVVQACHDMVHYDLFSICFIFLSIAFFQNLTFLLAIVYYFVLHFYVYPISFNVSFGFRSLLMQLSPCSSK